MKACGGRKATSRGPKTNRRLSVITCHDWQPGFRLLASIRDAGTTIFTVRGSPRPSASVINPRKRAATPADGKCINIYMCQDLGGPRVSRYLILKDLDLKNPEQIWSSSLNSRIRCLDLLGVSLRCPVAQSPPSGPAMVPAKAATLGSRGGRTWVVCGKSAIAGRFK